MKLTSVITNNRGRAGKICFPFLGISKDGFVVIFDKSGHGMVVHTDCIYEVGHYSDEWNMSCFDEFNGSLIIKSGEVKND